ncbi:hypothetical protein VE00_03039 [Pseudogymnoascus sp. WSF 3629]|nr:hypothetical protein VE00_03039 [Pseudogymnoascus sp. WSF 3629]
MADAAIPVELANKAIAPMSAYQAAKSHLQDDAATALAPMGHLRSASEYNVQGKEDAIIRDVSNRVIPSKHFISGPQLRAWGLLTGYLMSC